MTLDSYRCHRSLPGLAGWVFDPYRMVVFCYYRICLLLRVLLLSVLWPDGLSITQCFAEQAFDLRIIIDAGRWFVYHGCLDFQLAIS